jgi:hypothetical protein
MEVRVPIVWKDVAARELRL